MLIINHKSNSRGTTKRRHQTDVVPEKLQKYFSTYIYEELNTFSSEGGDRPAILVQFSTIYSTFVITHQRTEMDTAGGEIASCSVVTFLPS